ncbi:MAG: glycosyltransferase family 4 protein [Alphaproteobacteria bacterium]|nr:glycosyltransferase family 4 protein [Alphaproteobacteria bacterium]MBU1514497.1 glycosyltransferase family 4 protein [Alphaproteobacteria bacterium]MBU2096871.1 glycosyltransferase family 4 protein [Alphaproteobacteria bacterium]MBU2153498.1 glycosyltransferase family 4 protein [Alphaproteobacteria bacterium]MBU2305997.1 glycosyltransferase family 4 protein [Alphaproteobacteria bacterium]
MSGEPTTTDGLRGRLAILHPSGETTLAPNPFGKDVANLQLWQALARHGGYAGLDVLTLQPADPIKVAEGLLGSSGSATEVTTAHHALSRGHVEAGALLRGHPDLADLAWSRRRRASDRAYSLIGMIHTLAPPGIRQLIAAASTAPMYPWDALICTSPSVRDAMTMMFDEWGQHLADRTGGRPPPRPMLPVIPLGVDARGFAVQADRPEARTRARARFGLAEADALILWVGRLSYFEKAFPQAMFRAAQQAAESTGVRTAFVMAGWFPDEYDRGLYEAAARVHAPGVEVHFVDGNDGERLGDLWAGADIFLSLVDNIQETFGITPLEAMASGLPVVVSDWDGYRATVRHGVDGFLIPTLGGPPGGGMGGALVERHTIDAVSYQAYVGAVAQHTAVHAGRAGQALAELIRSPDLRRCMGQAGRARVVEIYDWPVVARQIHGLTDDLAAVRAAAGDPAYRVAQDPVRGDPFRAFAGFASQVLTLETRLRATPGITAETVRDAGAVVRLDTGFPDFRARPALCAEAFAMIAAAPDGLTPREVVINFPAPQRRGLELGLAWMAKCGFVDWLT